MPKVGHLAVHTADPAATAEFYKRVFDMEQVGPMK
jgi:catechol 2,3-dioxygenase-like lactoylglutathione lyase family enzyme